jgi:hypothetical protein
MWGTAYLVPGKKASNPSPADGSLNASKWAGLSWTAGISAASHNVYIGDNFDDVNNGTGGTLWGNETKTSLLVGFPGCPCPAGLTPGATYYWRIDEVNELDPESPWKGDVWSFSIAPQTAYNPDPADGAKFINTNVTLSWAAGMGARLHHLYLGENSADVDAGTADTYKGPVVGTTYTPSALELGKTYYWRVDEFDGVDTHKGNIWSFNTIPVLPVTDPNLVAWWKLDEAPGAVVVDWSGYAHHGKISGDVQWIDGIDGGALDFHGGIVEMLDYEGVLGTQNRTVIAWIKTTGYGDYISWGQNVNTQKWIGRVQDSAANGTVGALRTECSGGYVIGSTVLTDGQWHHVASVLESFGAPTVMDIKLYVDGQREIISGSQSVNINTVSAGRKVWLGEGHHVRPFPGQIDDVRIYDMALTQEAVKLTMRGDLRLAWNPKPANGSTPNIKDAVPISWSAGDKAAQHDVYFGTDKTKVDKADASDTTGVYRGRQSSTSYSPPEGVEWGGGPYYWRIDEYNTDATISTGRVWRFTVADFLAVDDFESYNDLDPTDPASNRIFSKWIDGYGTTTNGSVVGYENPPFAERTIVHSGGQSMPFAYNNSGTARYSEATLTLTYPRNWTEQGVKTLTLWFRGLSANTASPMYVALNGSAVVSHSNPNAAQIGVWTEWNIDLQVFAGQGVNLTNVNTITIGYGDKNNPQPGGSGVVYFDDIRLYR